MQKETLPMGENVVEKPPAGDAEAVKCEVPPAAPAHVEPGAAGQRAVQVQAPIVEQPNAKGEEGKNG
jgi:hypothetical protein